MFTRQNGPFGRRGNRLASNLADEDRLVYKASSNRRGQNGGFEAASRRRHHDGHGTSFGDRRDQAGQGAIFSLYGYEGLGRFYSGLRAGRERRLRAGGG